MMLSREVGYCRRKRHSKSFKKPADGFMILKVEHR